MVYNILPIGWLYITYHLLREPETAIDFRGYYYAYFGGSFVSSHHFRSTSPGCCSSTFDSWQLADSHALVSCGGGAACPGWDFSETLHPGRLTWNLQITHLERKMIFQTSMIMFHFNLPGCILVVYTHFQDWIFSGDMSLSPIFQGLILIDSGTYLEDRAPGQT